MQQKLRQQPTVAVRWPGREPSGWLLFEEPRAVLQAKSVEEVGPLLRRVERESRSGAYCAGFVAYEAAPAFDAAFLVRPASALPLAWFGVFDRPLPATVTPEAEGRFALSEWSGSVDRPRFLQAIAQVRESIQQGETYQTNYTYRFRADFEGDAWALFHALCAAQETEYSTFLDTGRYVVCSASPELFFERRGRRISCRPMKGTAPRGLTQAEDEVRARELRHSEKDRAENVMIVDMVRNDLGRIAKTGTVRVPHLFDVEKYRSIYQMTSTVEAETEGSLEQLFGALFPYASITGAPKIRTMELISGLETTPRGVYTGALGLVEPGGNCRFSVGIRTVVLDRHEGLAEFGTGGGIVWDSVAEMEYEESLTKALFLRRLGRPAFELLETLLWKPDSGYFLLERHLARLTASARYFSYALDLAELREQLELAAASFPAQPRRVRLRVGRGGKISIGSDPVPEQKEPVRLKLARQPVDRTDPFLYHKTTHREVYERAKKDISDCDDVLLWNSDGEVTESTIANVAACIDGQWITPPVECGLLPGTFRAELLEQGLLREERLTREELRRASEIRLLNSVRKWMPARLEGERALESA